MPIPLYTELPCCKCFARSTTLCASLADANMHRLYSRATERSFAAGKFIVRQEQAADFVFSIRSGYAAMFRLTAGGKRQILAFVFPGDFIGFTSEDNYHYGISTISSGEVCCFERNALEALIEEFPEMDRKLRFTLIRAMDATYELLFALGRKDAIQKVASFVWYINYRLRKLGEPDDLVHLPMSRADIADCLGLTIETVSRVFTTLKQSGVIRLHGANDVEIIDMQQLMSVGDLVVGANSIYRD